MAFKREPSRRFMPVGFGLRSGAVVLSVAGAVLVVVALAKSEADAIEIALFFFGTAIWSCAGIGFSFLWQRRQMAQPMTPMPHDARLVSIRARATWFGLFGILWLALVIVTTTSSNGLAAFGGLAIGMAAAYEWQARWVERVERKRGERWFSERRLRFRTRKPPYFARAIR
jgi:hypothetical protein